MGIVFGILVLLHVMAAIVGIGPAFALPVVGKSAKTASQLRFVLGITKKLNHFPKIGGITLFITGILLMMVSKVGFTLFWLNLSLALFIVIEIIIIGIVEPGMKQVGRRMMEHRGEEIPPDCLQALKKLARLQSVVHLLAVVIIVLMVWKPTF